MTTGAVFGEKKPGDCVKGFYGKCQMKITHGTRAVRQNYRTHPLHGLAVEGRSYVTD